MRTKRLFGMRGSKKREPITRAQREVLICLANGMRDAQIAEHLGISRETVRDHRKKMRKRINIVTAAQAVAWGFKNKILI